MMIFRVVITSVDEHAFCGRPHHPAASMIGRVALITKITAFCSDGQTELILSDENQDHGDGPYTILEGILADSGERIELVDHEVRFLGIEPEPAAAADRFSSPDR